MGAPSKAVAYIEMEDYLVLENASRYKHEYLDGGDLRHSGGAGAGYGGW